MADHLLQLGDALLVGRDLRFQIVDVLHRIAYRIPGLRQQRLQLPLAECPAIDQLEVVDIDALFLDVGRDRRHRPRRDTADIGMMSAASDPENDPALGLVEHRGADGDVGQMRPAIVGRVDRIDVAGPDIRILGQDRLDRFVHRPEMHGHVGRIGHQRTGGVENRAGEVEPFLDIDRVGGVLQRHAHLLGDRHEQVVEDLQHHRIRSRAHRGACRHRLDPGQHQVIAPGQPRLPALLHHDGLVRLDDDRRPGHPVPGSNGFALIDIGLMPATVAEEARRAHAPRASRRRSLGFRLAERRSATDGLDAYRLDHQRLGAVDKAKSRAMGDQEIVAQLLAMVGRNLAAATGEGGDFQRGVGSGVTNVRADVHGNGPAPDALPGKLRRAQVSEVPTDCSQRIAGRFQRHVEGLHADGANVCEPHAIGRQQAGHRVDQHFCHAERIGHQTGVLATGPAEAVQRIRGDVVTALHGDLLDRLRHVGDGDLDEAVGDLLGCLAAADLRRQRGEPVADDICIERLGLIRTEDRRKEIRHQLSGHDIGVGHRQRTAAAIAGRPRIGARGFRPDAEARAIELQQRSPACRHGVDQHHRGAHAHAGDLGLEGALIFAVEMGDVGRSAAHVEADDAAKAGGVPRFGKADHAAGGAGENGVAALEQVGGGETA